MFKYFPHTEEDRRAMAERIGIRSEAELFRDIPKDVLFRRDYDLPSAQSEIELRKTLADLEAQNAPKICFGGMGVYDHYAPAVLSQLTSRQEFQTAYTPYQPEVAQGTLQYIFEFQSMITMLTGMEVANASMYDGPTACAEAMFMAAGIARRDTILVSATVSPHVRAVLSTYAHFKGLRLEIVAEKEGITDRDDLDRLLNPSVAGLIVQKPNRYGIVEDYTGLSDRLHGQSSVLIEKADISTLAVLKTPGEDGADIACGDCQSLGMPMAFGGPYLGYLATRKTYVRKMPGRIVGQSFDKNGQRAFVLTLQAREQHIRREKANSNICSNQSLMALYATIYLSLLGPNGLREVNRLSHAGARYLEEKLLATGKFFREFERPYWKEFVLRTPLRPELMTKALSEAGFFGAIPVSEWEEGRGVLVDFAVTEQRSKAEIDRFAAVLGGLSC